MNTELTISDKAGAVKPMAFELDNPGECTPQPWTHDETWNLILGPNGEEVAAIHSGQGDWHRVNRHVAYDNAQFIVRACNRHEELLEVLRQCITEDGAFCMQHQETPGAMVRRLNTISGIARTAIAKATGTQ